MEILDQLVKKKIISQEDASSIEKSVTDDGVDLEEALLDKGVSSEDILIAKGEYYDVPYKKLEGQKITFDILKHIPEESAKHYAFVPIGLHEGMLEVGMLNPDDIEARDALTFISSKSGIPIKVFAILKADFDNTIQLYKSLSGEVTEALSKIEGSNGVDKIMSSDEEDEDVADTKVVEDAPVTKIVATILHYAAEGGASDIHIEPLVDKVRVRFRVDGVLDTSLVLPEKVHHSVVARIKILSNMRLDEKRKPQDGRFSARIEGRKIDFRVSTFPVYYGEKVVMRILDSEKGVSALDSVGFSSRDLGLVRKAIAKPYGLILISGPTGSGKTTTLYSMLNEVDRERKNVLSLEDPVEFSISGMNQSQVRPEIGYTFANGLRTTLRQDPDIIMVGEIRDKETAQLAVQAALTGHLVFSTIHTNNAIGVIPRLLDMGVDPYLIAPTLILAIAQRLSKKLCPGAGKQLPLEGSIKMIFDKQFEDVPLEFKNEIPNTGSVYEAVATADCPKGTRGRLPVFEVLEMTKEIEGVILKNGNEQDLVKVARKQGMFFMKEDAFIKSMKGLIPFEEVNKL